MNISAISDQEYQNIIDGFKRIQESSPNLELNPEISPRKLSRNIRNKKSKKFSKRKYNNANAFANETEDRTLPDQSPVSKLGDIFNYIPKKMLGLSYGNDAEELVSMVGQGVLGASAVHKYGAEEYLNNMIEKVNYKIKARSLMLTTISNHNARIAIIKSRMGRVGEGMKKKSESIFNFLNQKATSMME